MQLNTCKGYFHKHWNDCNVHVSANPEKMATVVNKTCSLKNIYSRICTLQYLKIIKKSKTYWKMLFLETVKCMVIFFPLLALNQ